MRFLKKMFVYFIGVIFNKMIIFLLLPIYTNNFSPAAYGNNDLSVTTVTMLVSLLYMELWTPLLRFSYDSDKESHKEKIFTNIFIIILICTPVFTVGSVVLGKWQSLPHVPLMLLYGYSLLGLNIYQFETRARGKSKLFMASGMISSGLQIVLSIILIYGVHLDSRTMLVSPVISNFAAIIFIEVNERYIKTIHKKYISIYLLKKICKYTFPLAINAVAFWGMTNINRYFARYYLGEVDNGYISLATKLAALINTIVQIFALAWQESAYEHSNSEERSQYYSRMLEIYLDVMAVGCMAVTVMTNILFPVFIDKSYSMTQMILPLYYISSFVNAISNFYGHIYNAEKKTNILLYSTLAGAAVNIALLYAFINKGGIFAVPLALTMGYAANVIMRIMKMSKVVKVRLHKRNIVADLVLLAGGPVLIYAGFSTTIKVLGMLICVLYFLSSYKTELLTYKEKLKKAKRRIR